MVSNIKIGNKTEKTISSILRQYGYWVYNCPRSTSGAQPVDFIAFKKNSKDKYIVWLIDGKHVRVQEASFPFARIEPNQIVSLQYAHDFSRVDIENLGFAIEFERTGVFYWFPFETYLKQAKNGQKSVNLKDLDLFEKELDKYE